MVRSTSGGPGFFLLEPEVAGGLGENAVIHHDQTPPRVERLHYEFDGWSGDNLLTSYPCFVVTLQMGEKLARAGLTGFALGGVEVSASETFRELYPGRRLPEFRRLEIFGVPGEQDFGLDRKARLIASKKALGVLQTGLLDACVVAPWVNASR